ncbi:MAG: shikimate kinase [Clostridia bacterium]|nr:shikimate kinase [Clostridia bacterium]
MNVILIGMPGCGKSTVGVLLAKALQLDFIDCDLVIQKTAKMGLQEIINTKGIEEFLKIEEKVLCDSNFADTVVATGGSAVYYPAAMEHLKKGAVTVYISLPYEEIQKRLSNIKTRGVAMQNGQTLKGIYDERRPLYEKYADITIESLGQGVEQTVEQVAKAIKEYLK